MRYEKNLFIKGKLDDIDFEEVKVGDEIELEQEDGYIAYGKILQKDNWNRLLVKFEKPETNPSYVIMKFQTWYIWSDAHEGIEYQSNGWEIAKDWWYSHKSNMTEEELVKHKKNLGDWLNKPLQAKPIEQDVMEQWADYNHKIMGWKGR